MIFSKNEITEIAEELAKHKYWFVFINPNYACSARTIWLINFIAFSNCSYTVPTIYWVNNHKNTNCAVSSCRNSLKHYDKKSLSKTTKILPKLEGYDDLLRDIKSILENARSRAYQAVDNIGVQARWQVGERIVREELKYKDRADYGKYLVNNLSVDLDVGKRDLYRIIRFYRLYEIVTTVSSQLSWSHYIELINISKKNNGFFIKTKLLYIPGVFKDYANK